MMRLIRLGEEKCIEQIRTKSSQLMINGSIIDSSPRLNLKTLRTKSHLRYRLPLVNASFF